MPPKRETTRQLRAKQEVLRLEEMLARRRAKVADAERKLAAARTRAKGAKS